MGQFWLRLDTSCLVVWADVVQALRYDGDVHVPESAASPVNTAAGKSDPEWSAKWPWMDDILPPRGGLSAIRHPTAAQATH